MNVLEVKNVSKKLGKRQIVKNISFQVEEGTVFGFLGPNGAGKTTTIKMMVGLISPDVGTINIMGKDIQQDREAALSYIGAVVENPELYSYMSGLENLMQLARINRSISSSDIVEVVDLVGLTDRIRDKVKKYSLGMKQRLGLAQALLSKPKVLILDEPTNGLDPTGIIEFRNLLKNLAAERNLTVFVSSHMLNEVQQLCDTVAFINDGEIKSVESVDNLNYDENLKDSQIIVLSSDELDKCIEILQSLSFVHKIKQENNQLFLTTDKGITPKLVFELAKNSVPINEIYNKRQVLEDRYIEIVKGGKN